MGRILRYLAVLVILAVIGLTGYGYLADLSPGQTEKHVPVMLDGG